MNIRVLPGWNAKVKGLRNPRAQISFRAPAVLKKGLSVGIVPSELMRKTFPRRFASVCEFDPLAFSPTAIYNLPRDPFPLTNILKFISENRTRGHAIRY